MKKAVIGILAHVDSGKTTLSEAMLYTCGEIRSLGRVDHKNTFLDTDEIERERKITIFSKQAVLTFGDAELTLLDTPGHVDFSSETERTLWVLDYAVLVISASSGVQSHTRTLFKLLEKHGIPTFVFVNKMDISPNDNKSIIKELSQKLGDGFVDFYCENANEEIAMCDENAMHEYLENGDISHDRTARLISQRKVFPCVFGSALKNQGVQELLEIIVSYCDEKKEGTSFGARVFKITQENNLRLTHMKITGGTLKVREMLKTGEEAEKINEIRIYSGQKYKSVQNVGAGEVCVIIGPVNTYNGQGLGFEKNSPSLVLEPVFLYKVVILDNTDARIAFAKLKKLEEEETQLRVNFDSVLGEIQLHLMGEVQLEVLKRVLSERHGLEVEFEQGGIVYKETIANKVEGVGHYEPLRHYAEVHLLLEPLKRGSGLVFCADCSEDVLQRSFQRLVLTHLAEKEHIGVLTGSPITDMKITLKSGKAHLKHTEGGDFRQATYRALRQGLRSAQSVLLEPYYSFILELPRDCTGRAMTDLEQMGASVSVDEVTDETAVITGTAPVRKLRHYQRSVTTYTHGLGNIACAFSGYEEAAEPEEIIAEINYDCDGDINNTADSVFCAHGAGSSVSWDKVPEYMHLESVLAPKKEITHAPLQKKKRFSYTDDELMEIFERTYGKIKTPDYNALKTPKKVAEEKKYRSAPPKKGPQYLLIDGYNIIFAWEEMKEVAKESLEDARNILIDRVCNYKIFRQCEIILVFDAYKVKGNPGEVEKVRGINVVYTKEAETADAYIEKTTHELGKKHFVRVATSDGLEQMIILGSGAQRLPAASFIKEIEEVEAEISTLINESNLNN